MARDFVTEPSPSAEPLRVSSADAASVSRAKKRPSPEMLMAEYISAYVAANRKQPDFRLVHVAGWVQFRSRRSSMVVDRKRLGALATMTKRLRERALLQGIEAEGRNAEGGSVHESPSAEGGAP